MVDISMCLNEKCPSKWKCHRFTASPNTHWQSYTEWVVPPRRKKCDEFIPNKGRVKQQRAVLAGIQSLEDMESGPRYRSRIAKLEAERDQLLARIDDTDSACADYAFAGAHTAREIIEKLHDRIRGYKTDRDLLAEANDQLRAELAKADGQINRCVDQNKYLESTISRLREYARHNTRCEKQRFHGARRCDCGYDELMAELEETK